MDIEAWKRKWFSQLRNINESSLASELLHRGFVQVEATGATVYFFWSDMSMKSLIGPTLLEMSGKRLSANWLGDKTLLLRARYIYFSSKLLESPRINCPCGGAHETHRIMRNRLHTSGGGLGTGTDGPQDWGTEASADSPSRRSMGVWMGNFLGYQ
jgi:hypothetical protein